MQGKSIALAVTLLTIGTGMLLMLAISLLMVGLGAAAGLAA